MEFINGRQGIGNVVFIVRRLDVTKSRWRFLSLQWKGRYKSLQAYRMVHISMAFTVMSYEVESRLRNMSVFTEMCVRTWLQEKE